MMEVDRLHRANFASGGYDLEIFDESEIRIEKYKCVVCRKVLKNAIQLPNSNIPSRACLTCYTENIR